MKVKGIKYETHLDNMLYFTNKDYDQNLKLHNVRKVGNFWQFSLRVESTKGKGARINEEGKPLSYACWHAHRDFFMDIFNHYPDAIIVTGHARYEGFEDFEMKFEETYFVAKGGTPDKPVYYGNLCKCGPNYPHWHDTPSK